MGARNHDRDDQDPDDDRDDRDDRRRRPSGAWLAVVGVFLVVALAGAVALVTRDGPVDVGSAGSSTSPPLLTSTTMYHGPDPTTIPSASTSSTSTTVPETTATTAATSAPTTSVVPTTRATTSRPPTTRVSTIPPSTTPVSPPPTTAPAGGFVTMVGVTAINPGLVIRFRGEVPAAVRADVEAVRLRVNAITGAQWRVGYPTDADAARNELVIEVRPPTRCSGYHPPGFIVYACAVRTANSAIVTVDLEISPALLGTPALLTTVLHELGHAAGLDDYNQLFGGRWQVMRTECMAGLIDYEAGDLNGLRWLAR